MIHQITDAGFGEPASWHAVWSLGPPLPWQAAGTLAMTADRLSGLLMQIPACR
jgi:hypothetical protein